MPANAKAILLLEDDPVSLEFLSAALAPLDALVRTAMTLQQARALLAAQAFDLLLLDLALPDGAGLDLLTEVRSGTGPTRCAVPALALSAELDESRRRSLRQAGFDDALSKPLTTTDLHKASARWLRTAGDGRGESAAQEPVRAPIWDEAAALAACGGSAEVLASLRGLFLGELPDHLQRIAQALDKGEAGAAIDVLHRLQAGCGFCGAAAIAIAARDLSACLRAELDCNAARQGLESAAADLMALQIAR